MKVLWITNTIFPEPSRTIGRPAPVIGGWMYGLAERVSRTPDVHLAVATTYPGNEFRQMDISGTRYYLLPARPVRTYQPALEPVWRKLCDLFEPDLVHLHGTENPHGLACMRACPAIPYVVSVQGLTSINARYHYGGIDPLILLRYLTFRDILKRDSVLHTKRQRDRCAPYERESLRTARVVVGRTTWDRIHVKAIAPKADYVICNESFRDPFYNGAKWSAETRRRHTIFVSQAHTPMKGLHQVLRAVALLRPEFPGLKLRIAGHNIVANGSFKQRLMRTGYGSYVESLASELGVEDVMEFTGLLTAEDMVAEYRAAHVFICPSAIENSPNSIGEAQLVGVPVIATYAGGIPDLVTHAETGLIYRFEEVEMLAEHIRQVMNDDTFADKISANQIEAATQRHDPVANHQTMMRIYERARGYSS
jgi:glycosyltransferase involved in cell wall biosynthesis